MTGDPCQNILIVDDSAASLKMAAILISRPDREVYLARDGAEALELAGERDYDLFLLDILMPGMSGLELCTRLKAQPSWAETPVIFLSAVQDRENLILAFEAGAADYVTKPFNPRELNARVDSQLKISQQRRQLKRKISDLELLNQQLDAFSYSASHDLKSPLFVINSYVQVLQDKCRMHLDPDSHQMLGRIAAAGQRMSRLIDELLAFSRSANSLDYGLVDLSGMAESIAEELRQGAPQRRAEFAIEPGVSVLGDAVLLRSVLQNLLANAWKYSANTGLARIAFGRGDSRAVPGEAVDGDIVCFVSDNGAGFDPALAADLFQPFKRLHAARDFQGHGLGLAMAKRIIDRHSGRIWAEGQPGQGARFWFSLPGFNTAPRSAGQ